MSKKIQIEYCGMPGEGETVKAAKQNAANKIESLLADLHTPILIRWRDDGMLIFRDAHGWLYACLHGFQTKESNTGEYGGTCCGFESLESAKRAAIMHLADMARLEGETEIPEIITKCHLRESVRRDMEREYIDRGKRDDENRQRAREADAIGLTGNDRYCYIVKYPGWEALAKQNASAA